MYPVETANIGMTLHLPPMAKIAVAAAAAAAQPTFIESESSAAALMSIDCVQASIADTKRMCRQHRRAQQKTCMTVILLCP